MSDFRCSVDLYAEFDEGHITHWEATLRDEEGAELRGFDDATLTGLFRHLVDAVYAEVQGNAG